MIDLTAYRQEHGITASEVVEAVREQFPKYSKATQSMVEHPREYAVQLLDEAEQLIMAAFGPDDEKVSDELLKFIEIIPYGANLALSRTELASRAGMSDRAARKMIEQARAAGYMIMTKPRGGYYFSDDPADDLRQYRIDYARAMSLLKRLAPARRRLKKAGLL